jgi:hypothetical protein
MPANTTTTIAATIHRSLFIPISPFTEVVNLGGGKLLGRPKGDAGLPSNFPVAFRTPKSLMVNVQTKSYARPGGIGV